MSSEPHAAPAGANLKARLSLGRSLRAAVPRSAHATVPAFERDAVRIIVASNQGRLPSLIPIRYERMLQSAFAFYRGAAALMALDLASTPTTHLHLQLCGDCHLLNFGAYGTPERNLVFDINDFDETLPGPWEWDVKRLATSFVVAARFRGFDARAQRRSARMAVATYRERMAELARMSPLQVWYSSIQAADIARLGSRPGRQTLASARKHDAASLLPSLCESVHGELRLKDDPPLLQHADPGDKLMSEVPDLLHTYEHDLLDNRRVLLSRYRFVDVAIKVVGVGSVGTRCLAALLLSADNQPLILQLKEARESVLAPWAGRSQYTHQGKRVVEGQRLMQAATDLFLGATHSSSTGLEFYVRQLRDWKGSLDLDSLTNPTVLDDYARLCGWALARAHARAGGVAAHIAGYLGSQPNFDRAVTDFASAYADQNERDFSALQAAHKSGDLAIT